MTISIMTHHIIPLAAIALLLASCSTSRTTHRTTVTDSQSVATITDSLSRIIRTDTWTTSGAIITIRQIQFDTSRLDTAGHPLPQQQTITTIQTDSQTLTQSSDSTTRHRTDVTRQQQHQQEQQQSHTQAQPRFIIYSDAILLLLVISAAVYAFRTFSKSYHQTSNGRQ